MSRNWLYLTPSFWGTDKAPAWINMDQIVMIRPQDNGEMTTLFTPDGRTITILEKIERSINDGTWQVVE